jgi:hypothetical protein
MINRYNTIIWLHMMIIFVALQFIMEQDLVHSLGADTYMVKRV